MRGLVIFLLVLVVIASLSVVAINLKNNKVEAKKESKSFEFSAFTSAVCENKENFVYCKDEVFVNCNGKISKATDVAECDGMKIDVPKVTGFAVFEKEWKDPRN